MNNHVALWVLMTWCFSTRALVATVLSIHPSISSCLWGNASGDNKAINMKTLSSSVDWYHTETEKYGWLISSSTGML